MAEDILIAIIAQVGKEYYKEWRKRARSIKINPKKMLRNVERRSGFLNLCDFVDSYFEVLGRSSFNEKIFVDDFESDNWDDENFEHISSTILVGDSNTREEYKKLLIRVNERGSFSEFSGNELIDLGIKKLRLHQQVVGVSDGLRKFTSYFLEHLCPSLQMWVSPEAVQPNTDFLRFKNKFANSIHLTRNFGFSKKREFLEILSIVYNIDLLTWDEDVSDLKWVDIKERILFLSWANDNKPKDFSLLK